MNALVTGATGFIGGNLVIELLSHGYQVRALARKSSNLMNLGGLDVEIVRGDLRDKASLKNALDGCDFLFHVAAEYSLWTPDPRAIYATNVKGTENLFAVALELGIRRVVYTSTESTIGVAGKRTPGTESTTARFQELPGHYKRSKYLAEQVALRYCGEGLPLVVVNPTVPIGPRDLKPTPTGRIIVDFLRGRMPAYVDTGLNLVDVQDVARGHILALERGRVGERYILGNRNITLQELLGMLETITGIKAPRLRIPLWLALGAAYVDEIALAPVMRRPPRIPLAGVKAAGKFRYFDCTKAIRELGLPQTPVEEALEKSVKWFKKNGYA